MLKITKKTAVNKSQNPRRKDFPFLKRNFRGNQKVTNLISNIQELHNIAMLNHTQGLRKLPH